MTIPRLPREQFGKGAKVLNIPARWDSPGQFKGKPQAEDKAPKPTAEKPKEGK